MKQWRFSLVSSLAICLRAIASPASPPLHPSSETSALSTRPSTPNVSGSMNVATLALGTRGGPARPKSNLPPVLAITALKLSLVNHFNLSTFNLERLGVCQGVGNLPVRRLHNTAEGLAGDAHVLGGVLLVKPHEISEADGLVLVHRHRDDLHHV
jgi:hypothetical protein